jgi:pimeloyl-ACP methyl ester carboxylesterase
MTGVPKTRYARTASGAHIAYQVVGEGSTDLVFVPSAMSHIEVVWEDQASARYLRSVSAFSRLILFDKRGVGMSDRIEGIATIEDRMDDVRAVMDAVGSQRAALCGMSEGGAIAAVFAATYPERVSELILFNGQIKPWIKPDMRPSIDAYINDHWGEGGSITLGAPSVADDPQIRSHAARIERMSTSPAGAVAIGAMNDQIDVRSVLPTVSVPTLVMHRTGDLTVDITQGREAAELIPNARMVELPGTDHLPYWEDCDTTLGLIEEFVTGHRRPVESDRLLATVLFTDIVGSSAKAALLGDRQWKELLDDYDAMVNNQLGRFRGQMIKTTGDGTLATFDGPGRAIRCAREVRDAAQRLGLALRVGLHTGEIELRGEDVTGLAVVIANRVCTLANDGELLVSSKVKDLVVGSGIEFEDRGEEQLKGVPGAWRLFAVES